MENKEIQMTGDLQTSVKRLDRRRDPAKTREALVNSGIQLFNEPGYFFTDSNQIARHAGFAPGTFYQHFKNKNELFLEIFRLWLEQHRENVEKSLAASTSPEQFATIMAKGLLPLFEQSAGFRASVRALCATDKPTNEFRRNRMIEFVELCNKARQHYGLQVIAAHKVLEKLMMMERYADALADGEFAAFGISRPEVETLVTNIVRDLMK